MAITVTPNLTLVSACDSITNWSGGTRFELDTSVKIQNTGCLADWIDATTMPVAEYAIGTSTDMSNGDHLYCWVNCSGVVDTKANGGYRLYAEDSSGNSSTWYVGGSDTHSNGWQLMVCSLDATPDASSGTLDTSDVTIIGVSFKTLTAAAKKGQTYIMNCFWDVIRYGTGLTITSGATDDITMEDIFAVDNLLANKYGVVQKSYGAYVISGTLIFGDESTGSVDAILDGEVLLYPDNDLVSTTFNTVRVLGNATGTTNLSVTGSFIKANNVAGTLDLNGANLNTISLIGNSFVNMGACDFAASQTVTNNVFDNCAQVDPSTATFSSNTLKNCVATDGALYWRASSNTQKNIFINCDRGVEVTQTTNQSFTDMVFDDEAGNYDVHLNNGGTDIDISKTGTTNANSYVATGGGVVTFVGASVTASLHVSAYGVDLAGANVLVEASDGTGPFPYKETVTITSVSTTATVSHTAHGLTTGDKVKIRKANQYEYNGVYAVTVTGANSYTYTFAGSATSPATGTITSNFVALQGLTDSNGELSAERVYSSDQPVTGWIRKGSVSPFYQQGAVAGNIDSATGYHANVQMILDE